ncbi:MAG: class I SAM-dependent methyltransferase [Pseudonocardiaceae bacterium]
MSEGIDVDAFVRFEAEGWSRVPEGYHRFFGPITGRAAEPLLDAAGVGAGTRVLDVATGPGYLAGRAAARGASVVGVDFAPEILALATDLNPAVEFRRGDAHDLPFEDCSFDAVVSGFLLPHLGDHAQAMGELVRVLTPAGRLAVSTWDLPERTAIPGLLLAAVQQAGANPPADLPAGPPFFQYSDDDALMGLLRSAGLDDVAVARLAFTHRLSSVTTLWDGLLTGTVRAAPLVRRQPEPVQGRIRAAFDDLAARYHTGGSLELPVSIKLASGQKPSGA